MHEVGLMQNALELATVAAEQQGATRIHRLTLRIGALAGVEPLAMEFAFDVVSANTLARHAEFAIETVPIICYCGACSREFEPASFVFRCPDCGELSIDVRQGRELELASLEVS